MDKPEDLYAPMVRAIGQLTAVLAGHLHAKGIVSPNTLAANLGMMAAVSDHDPEAGMIVASWAAIMEDLAADLGLPPSAYLDPERKPLQ